MPSASSCLLHILCFAENPYQTKSKRDEKLWRFFWNICEFWEVELTEGGARGAHKPGGMAQGVGRARVACGHPVRWLVPFFCYKKANIRIKIVLKFHPNQSYESPGI